MRAIWPLSAIRARRDRASHECYTCKGSGRVPHECACCGRAIAHVDALCEGCALNGCYVKPFDRDRFSDVQHLAYLRYRDRRGGK